MKDHRLIDERSLAFHQLIAAKMRTSSAPIEKARENIRRWRLNASPGVRAALLEWREALDGPPGNLARLLESDDEHATRLRQSSPFAGCLTEEERGTILSDFQRRESATT